MKTAFECPGEAVAEGLAHPEVSATRHECAPPTRCPESGVAPPPLNWSSAAAGRALAVVESGGSSGREYSPAVGLRRFSRAIVNQKDRGFAVGR